MAKAIDLMAQARRIEFFGFGVPCVAHTDSHQQFIAASMMGPGDLAVAVSNTGQTTAVLDVMRATGRMGATVIGISGRRGGPMERSCDLLLVVETLENTDIYTPTISRLAALVPVDVLSVGVAMRRGADHQRRIAAMKRRLAVMRTSHPDGPED